MGRLSKATIARRRNGRAQNPTVEDVSEDEDMNFEEDDLLDEGFFFLDEGDPLDEGSNNFSEDEDEEVDEDEPNELQNEAAINHFNAVLREAQDMAVKAEREAAGGKPKRKRHYTRNAPRTKRYHAQMRRELSASGQTLISSMFHKKSNSIPQSSTAHPPETIEIMDEDCEPEEEDEIDASLQRLFPKKNQVIVSLLIWNIMVVSH